MPLVFFAALLAGVLSASAVSAACDEAGARQARSGCRQVEKAKKFEPYEPRAPRSGSSPGFIDMGGGTEVRIGGRVRTEYQYTR